MAEPSYLKLVFLQLLVIVFLKPEIFPLHVCLDGVCQIRGQINTGKVGGDTGQHTGISRRGQVGGKADQTDYCCKRSQADQTEKQPGTPVQKLAGFQKPSVHGPVKNKPEEQGYNFRQIGEQQIGKSHSAPKSKENPGPDIIQEKIQSCGNGIEDHYSRNLQIPGSFKEKGSPKEKA